MIKRILISAGHTNVAGQDRGAVGSGFIEGVEATKLRDATAAKLRALGHTVVEDGSDGVNDPLKRAIQLAKQSNIAIEFHFNAGGVGANGIEVLAKPKHKALAIRIAEAIHDATGLNLRGQRGWKSDSSGQHHRLAFCEAGGLIVEVCFISNAADMAAYVAKFDAITTSVANAIAGTTTPATPPATAQPRAILKRGAKSDAVGRLQKALGITVDNDFGQKTYDAVVAFQRANGLYVDGRAGDETHKALGLI